MHEKNSLKCVSFQDTAIKYNLNDTAMEFSIKLEMFLNTVLPTRCLSLQNAKVEKGHNSHKINLTGDQNQ